MYTLHLLGSPFLAGPDGPIPGRVAQERKLAFLAVLALGEGRYLSRDFLAAMFWPESDQVRARHNVADAVWVVRSALGEEVLVSRPGTLWLNPEVVASDVGAFEEALLDGDREGAVAAYTGPLMEGFHISGAPDFEHWVDRERARLAAAHADALEELAGTALRAGAPAEAAAWTRRLVAADPLSTRGALLLMDALAAAGDLAGALRHGEAHGRLLESELGVAPFELEERIQELRTSPPPLSGASLIVPADTAGVHAAPPASGASATATSASVPSGGEEGGEGSSPATSAPFPRPPVRRPRGRGVRPAWLLATLALAGGLVAWLFPSLTPGDPPATVPSRIVVLSFENRTGDEALDLVGRMAADALVRGLTEVRLGHVILPADLMGTGVGAGEGLRGPDRAGDAARRYGAGITVSGTVDPGGEGPVLFATVSVAPRGPVLAVLGPEPLDPNGVAASMAGLSSRVVGTVAAHLGHDALELPFIVRTPSYESYRTADRAMALFLQMRYTESASLFAEAYELDPSAVGYLLWEGVSHWNRSDYARVSAILDELRPRRGELSRFDATQFDWLESRLRGDAAAALRVTLRAHAVHPHSGVGGFQLGRELLRSGQAAEALEVLLDLDPDRGWLAGWEPYWTHLAGAYHFLGRHEEELAAAEEGFRRHGGSASATWRLRALAAMGRVGELTEALRESATLPGHAVTAARALHRHGYEVAAVAIAEEGLRTLQATPPSPEAFPATRWARKNREARLLMTAGRLEEARGIFLELLAENPTHRDLLGWTGFVEARLGMEGEARERLAMLESLDGRPYSFGGHTVARAAIHAELGDDPTFVRFLLEGSRRQGWALSYFHFTPLFDPVREHPDVRGFFEPVR